MSKHWPSSQLCLCWLFNVGRGSTKPTVVACKDLTWILRNGPDFLLQA